ncbi:MAG: AI-2E family transporter [Rhodothermales bacterium]
MSERDRYALGPMQYARINTVLLAFLALCVGGFVLHQLKVVLLPFTVAALFSVVFEPVIRFLKVRQWPTVLGLIVIFLFLMLLGVLFSLVFTATATAFLDALPRYEPRFDALFDGAIARIDAIATRLNLHPPDLDAPVSFTALTSTARAGVNTLISFVSNAFLILLFMLFMLMGAGDTNAKLRRVLPAHTAERIVSAGLNIGVQMRHYLLTKTIISAVTGVVSFAILWLIGVDFALMWGILAFLLNFIPNVGSIVASILPAIWALLQFDTILQGILVAVFLTATQMTLGNVIEPRVMAFRLNLSPLLVLVALIFWGWLWGIWGMILAVPLMSAIKIVLENIEPLRPVAILMGDAPERSPHRGSRGHSTP